MKKTLQLLLVLTLLSATPFVHAQIINPGFETWTTDLLVPTAMNPNSGNGTTGWWDYNYFNSTLLGSSPISVTRCTDTVHSGLYSVRLETKVYTSVSWNIYKSWGYPFIGHEYNDTLGIVFNGYVDATVPSFKPGFPYTERPTQVKFFYQYKPVGNDTAECRIELLKTMIPVAGGTFKTGVATGSSGWQQAVIDLTYVNALIPDTLWIIFSSSSFDYAPVAGSVMWIDDVSVTLPTGIEKILGEEKGMEIFPNPTNGQFTIINPGKGTNQQSIEIYNTMGKRIYKSTVTQNTSYEIDLSDHPKGIYFVTIIDDTKNLTTKKIIKL